MAFFIYRDNISWSGAEPARTATAIRGRDTAPGFFILWGETP